MQLNFNKEQFELVKQKTFKFLNYTFPGVIIMEFIFGFGIFSSTPENLYSFLIYACWVVGMSFPFSFFQPNNVSNIMYKVTSIFTLDEEFTKDHRELLSDELKEAFDDSQETIEFGFNVIKVLIVLTIYKILIFLPLDKYYTFFIGSKYLFFISSLVLGSIFLIPIGWIYQKFVLFICIRHKNMLKK